MKTATAGDFSSGVAGVLILVALAGGSLNARAVVDASSQANTNAPSDGAPWGNVGTVNGLSGVYVANGWVLTASHVGAGNFTLNGATFSYDGNSQRLTNSDGTSTDLILFHVSGAGALPVLALTATSPAVDSPVDMVGYGYYAGSGQMTFGSYTGFTWSAQPAKSWGNNEVSSTGQVINAGYGNVTTFVTQFVASGPTRTSNEAQAATGDSGGGVFQQVSGNWELVGILDAIGVFSGQPSNASVYGQVTYSADVATYRSQMLSILASTPPILSIARAGNVLQVCWPDTGVAYNLQGTTTLNSPNWASVPQPQEVTNGQVCVWLPSTNAASFFRLHKAGS